MKYSLLHATRGTPQRAIETRHRWLTNANKPEEVEHVFAYQADDAASAELIGKDSMLESVTTRPPPDWASSSVANWNAAAWQSTGDWLIVIADDLQPVTGWDSLLTRDILSAPDPTQPLAIQAPDGISNDLFLRHPIINRSLLELRGYIFHPDFYGVFCDNDLTAWCFKHARVTLAQHFSVRHVHPINGQREHDAISKLQNSKRAYEYGQNIMKKHWNDDGSEKR